MPVIHRTALVPYSAPQMYDLVADVRAYPEFVPWVKRTMVQDQNQQTVMASIELAKGPIRKTFTTLNELAEGKDSMTLNLVEGPFHHLRGRWGFQSLGQEGCKVTLDMDFEFSNRVLAMTVGPIFSELANRLVDAFVERASKVYG